MARIRSIKPDFFRHEGLQDLEISNPGKHLMLVFAGLWVVADREGRFEWRPRRLKLDVLPFLEFDMGEAMSILAEAGFLIRYESDGEEYGVVSSWDRHQIVGRDEPPSEIPAPDGSMTPYFRPLNQTQRLKVYERDQWTCCYCGRNMANDKRAACLDHVFPYSRGGTNRPGNLATACKRCNSAKSDKTPEEAGFNWPNGLGEYLDKDTNKLRQCHVNTPLTPLSDPPDKEREGELGMEGNGCLPPTEVGKTGKPVCPPCPIDEIIETYHETLPTNPRFLVRNDTRDGYIRSRWKQFFSEGDFTDRGGGIECFRWFFAEKVKPSKFLTGQAAARNGAPPFIADLEWLMRPTNFAKVVEGKYS